MADLFVILVQSVHFNLPSNFRIHAANNSAPRDEGISDFYLCQINRLHGLTMIIFIEVIRFLLTGVYRTYIVKVYVTRVPGLWVCFHFLPSFPTFCYYFIGKVHTAFDCKSKQLNGIQNDSICGSGLRAFFMRHLEPSENGDFIE